MRLRPATPLAIAFFIAFILLLISTISTPIVKAIPLAVYSDIRFGVFGYCGPHNFCSKPTVRYHIDADGLGDGGNWSIAEPTRLSLSSILIVHPIAAFLTLVCTIMATAAHFHAPSHSAPFLLWLLILSFPTLLITLLAFLVDILLFVPHLAWGGWIVLGSTVLISCCSVLTCAMRRTLVSRKARKKRIAEDVDMNGTNAQDIYSSTSEPQLAKEPPMSRESEYIRADSPPPIGGASQGDRGFGGDKLPNFATYDAERSRRPSTDDRAPLNPNRDPSIRSNSTGAGRSHHGSERHRLQVAPIDRIGYGNDGRVSPVSPMEYDNGTYGDQYGRRPDDRYYNGPGGQQRGRGGPPPFYSRGRGGYPPPRGGYMQRGGGGYPPRGGPATRGAYPPRAMYNSRGGPGGSRGQSQPGWREDISMGPMAAGAGAGAGAGAAAGAMMGRGQRGPPSYENQYPPYNQSHSQPGYGDYTGNNPYDEQPSYDQQNQPLPPPNPTYRNDGAPYGSAPNSRGQSPARPSASSPRDATSFGFSGRQPSPARSRSVPREEVSPNVPPMPRTAREELPIGQAIEMDAASGNPALSGQNDSNPISPIGAAIGDIHRGFSPHAQSPTTAPPIEIGTSTPSTAYTQHVTSHDAPIELPGHAVPARNRTRASSDAYYEDVDPRFANDGPLPPQPQHPAHSQQQQPIPASLTPGARTHDLRSAGQNQSGLAHNPSASSYYLNNTNNNGLPPRDQSLGQGLAHDPTGRTISPGAASDGASSNFSSVSQRGINPNWAPPSGGPSPAPPPGAFGGPGHGQAVYRGPYGGVHGGAPPPQRQRERAEEQVLSSNPDFQVMGMGMGRGPVRGHGHVRGASSGGGSHVYPSV